MLRRLFIENFALIDHLEIEFVKGLNVITGETGAGKSILIDGLKFVLGDRAQSVYLRRPDQPCVVEAEWEATDLSFLPSDVREALDVDPDDPVVIVRREWHPAGRNKIRVNQAGWTVQSLKTLGDAWVDLHGPYDHQSLLSSFVHQHLLDRFAGLDALLKEYRDVYEEWRRCDQKRQALLEVGRRRAREWDLLEHEQDLLQSVPLDETAYEQLRRRLKQHRHAHQLLALTDELLQQLDAEPSGAAEALRHAYGSLRRLRDLDPDRAQEWQSLLEAAQSTLSELISEIRRYATSLQDIEQDDGASLETTHDRYQEILRRYGGFKEAKAALDEITERMDQLQNWDDHLRDISAAQERLFKRLEKLSDALTKKRQSAAQQLVSAIQHTLKELAMPHARFDVVFHPIAGHPPLGPLGSERVEFLISVNAGERLKPLSDVISSGEAARVMLALKRVLMAVDPVPVLVFDEIDAQVGGRLGSVIGRMLKDISAQRQVILITHLPQIAALGDRHWKVIKHTTPEGTTQVSLEDLSDAQKRVQELAEMLSGPRPSASSLQHALEMLQGPFSESNTAPRRLSEIAVAAERPTDKKRPSLRRRS